MYYFKVAVVFLTCVGVTSSSSVFTLSSIYRPGRHCNTSLVSINTHRCTNSSGRRQCPLNWEGFTSSNSTHFQIEKIKNGQGKRLRCIQVENDGVNYTLKVIQSNHTLVFEEHRCSSSYSATDDLFIFKVKYPLNHSGDRRHAFQPIAADRPMCIASTGDCSESLALVIPSNSIHEDRRCRFRRKKL